MNATHSRHLFAMTALLAIAASGAALWFQWAEGGLDPLDRVMLPALAVIWLFLGLGLQLRKVRLRQAQVIVFVAYAAYFLLALNHQFRVFAPHYHMLSESTYWFTPLYAAAFMYFLPRTALRFSFSLFLLSVGIVLLNFILNPALLTDGQLVASCVQFLLVGAGMTALQFVMGQRHASMLATQVAAYRDALTGAANRRAAEEQLLSLENSGQLFTLALLDLDYFKRINDQYGHAVGDQTLKAVVGTLQSGVPAETLVARWGGEEFLLILSDLPQADLQVLFSALRERLAAQQVGPVLGLTASFGVAKRRPAEAVTSLLERADRALYAAKAAGRDTVRFADWSPPPPTSESLHPSLTT